MILRSLLTGHPKRALKQARFWHILRGNQNLRLHIGCGQRRLEGFINIDRNLSAATDFISDSKHLPCRDNSVERIETYHLIEHIPRPDIGQVFAEWRRVLKTGGVLVIECPDFDTAVRRYVAGDQGMLFSVFGRHRFPGDEHSWGYSASSLMTMVENQGFSGTLCAPTDYHKHTEPCLRIECKKC